MIPGGLPELVHSPTRPTGSLARVTQLEASPQTRSTGPTAPAPNPAIFGTFSSLWRGLRNEATGFWRVMSEDTSSHASATNAVGSKRLRRDSDSPEVMCATAASHERRNSGDDVPDRKRRRREELISTVPKQITASIHPDDIDAGQTLTLPGPSIESTLVRSSASASLRPALAKSPARTKARQADRRSRAPGNHVHFEFPVVRQSTVAMQQTSQVASALLGASSGTQDLTNFPRIPRSLDDQFNTTDMDDISGLVDLESDRRRIAELEAEVERLRNELSRARQTPVKMSPARRAPPPPPPAPPPPPLPGTGTWRQRLRPTTPERREGAANNGHKRRMSSIGGSNSSLDMGAFLNEMRTKKLRKVGPTSLTDVSGSVRLDQRHSTATGSGHRRSRSSASTVTVISDPTPNATSSSLLIGPTVSPSMPVERPRPAPAPPGLAPTSAPATPSPRQGKEPSAASQRLSAARRPQAPLDGSDGDSGLGVINYSRPITPARRRAMEKAKALAQSQVQSQAQAMPHDESANNPSQRRIPRAARRVVVVTPSLGERDQSSVVQQPHRTSSRSSQTTRTLADSDSTLLDVMLRSDDIDALLEEEQQENAELNGVGTLPPDPSRPVSRGVSVAHQTQGESEKRWKHRGGEWDGWDLRRAEEGGE